MVHVDLEISELISDHIDIQKIRHGFKDKREYINKVLADDLKLNGIPTIKQEG